jgi:hypothetical protein
MVHYSQKLCRKGDAIDIDNFNDYKELIERILERKPSKITIFIDMADIQKSWRSVSSKVLAAEHHLTLPV